jgi:hypothetical protein
MLLHQEFSIFAWNTHGAMVVDDVVPAVLGDQAINRRKVDARLPLCG